ncbi:MAG TPA: primase-helicase zinc-binding domain-containing protein [Candidatus Obscuribacterales bacterium]
MSLEHPYARCARRCTFADIRQKAAGNWTNVLAAAGIPEKFLTKKHGPCPACGGKDRFRFDDKNGDGTFFCNQCGAGDGFRLIEVIRGCSAKESLNLVADILDGARPYCAQVPTKGFGSQPKKRKPRLNELVMSIWSESNPIRECDPPWLYLCRERGFKLDEVPEVLRYHPALGFYDDDKRLVAECPALVARIDSPSGEMVGLHRIYLTADGKKAFGEGDKKFLTNGQPGALKGAAVRLFSVVQTFGIAEGIETALACWLLFGVPTWAGLTAWGLENIALPKEATEVIAFVDNDTSGKGKKHADMLGRRAIHEGLTFKQLLPPNAGQDWADVYIEMMSSEVVQHG